MDLFETAGHQAGHEPLAARMRPRTLDEYIGQDEIIGPGRLLRRAIQADRLTSVIFYGPPGTGKTTLARVIANHTKSNFITLNAVLAGVQQIREAIKQAEDHRNMYQRKTILFVDEVHRWNRAQQDALLPWVENGTIILIGATTENPFFEVNKALVSRSRIFQLKPLETADLLKAATMAIHDVDRGYGRWNVVFDDGVLQHLAETASGDARSMLNALELAIETTPDHWPPADQSEIRITMATAEESIQQKVVLYDRDGDYHYDVISAFIKSLRGRDPDAALYWLARMIAAGENPSFIFRRMLISASEDTGLADPHAIGVVESCAAAFDRVGLPEGRFFLTQAALYLATCPKSNSAMAFFDAIAAVEKEDAEVPSPLCDGNRDAEGFGHGAGYMYPHAYRDHWVAQQYLPDSLAGRVFYTPSAQGYEATIREDVLTRRELQIAAILAGAGLEVKAADSYGQNPVPEYWQKLHEENASRRSGEVLTFSPHDSGKESWINRIESGMTESLMSIRDNVIEAASLRRNSRVLVLGADDGLFLWESIRRTPEGCTGGICYSPQRRQVLEQYANTLGELDRPHLADADQCLPPDVVTLFNDSAVLYDAVLCRDVFSTGITETAGGGYCLANVDNVKDKAAPEIWHELLTAFVSTVSAVVADGGVFVCVQKIPRDGQRLSALIGGGVLQRGGASDGDMGDRQRLSALIGGGDLNMSALEHMKNAEDDLFSDTSRLLFCIDRASIEEAFSVAGFTVTVRDVSYPVQRRITESDIDAWLNPERGYGATLARYCSIEEKDVLRTQLCKVAQKGAVTWNTTQLLFSARKR